VESPASPRNIGHEVHLAAALQRVHAFFRCGRDVAVEIGGALLELGEILDGLQSPLRAKEPLNVHATQRQRFGSVAEPLRASIRREVEGAILVSVRVAVEARDALAGHH
jgi:hypothetical protein